MLIIPEIKTVLILVPRTGSTALKQAVQRKYPKAMLPYRHMEADGVPHGYDRWRRVGVCRDPIDRLWSLYNFIRRMKNEPNWHPKWCERQKSTANELLFEQWVMRNEVVFTDPYDSAFQGDYWPSHAVMHPLPENRKSQFHYLRPDLGTEVVAYRNIDSLAAELDVRLERVNESGGPDRAAKYSVEFVDYMRGCFEYDFAASRRPKAYF